MRKILLSGVFLIALPCLAQERTIRLLVITGGHDYPTGFYTLFQGYRDLKWDHAVHCAAAEGYLPNMGRNYDVVLLYDVQKSDVPEGRKRNLMSYAEAGGGLVALHHVLASMPEWGQFHELIGGEYLWSEKRDLPPSTYQFDVNMRVKVTDRLHPVTRGIPDFDLHDEAYGGLWVAPGAHVLLSTDHPASNRALAWVMQGTRARVVTIVPGHGEEAFSNRFYRKLVIQAIRWAAAARQQP